ncbi:MAG: helix-turn-helix domain-containing protein, partial [Nocardioides sp.]
LAVPMGLTTRVAHADGDLVEQLEALARGRADVVGLEPRPTERLESPVERPTAVDEPTTPVADRTAPSTPVDEEPAPGPVRSVPRGPSADEPATVTDRTVPGIEAEPEDAAAPEQELPASPAAAARPVRPRRSLVGEIGTIVSRVAKGRSSATVAPETDTAAEVPEVPDDTDAAGTDRQAEEAASPAPAGEPVPERVRPAATVAPLRDLRRALRAEITRDTPATTLGAAALATDPADRTSGRTGLPEGRELRRPGSVDLVFEPVPTDTRVRPISQLGDAVEPLVIDDFVTEPAYDPVIGPELAAARRRLGLSVDELADRTRIRPHVSESIEVDDFAPCGGDFYARGHLRTLARVLGKDVAPLLEQFDARYATAPINARRVFEAELATGMTGTMRSTAGGPNWSLLVGVVLSLLLVWGVVRLFVTEPAEQLAPSAPVLSGSAGVGRGAPEAGAVPAAGAPVAVVVASARRSLVVVRDADGKVVWAGRVAPGGSHRLRALPPVSVQATHAGGVTVSLAGQRRGPVSTAGGTATRTYRR